MPPAPFPAAGSSAPQTTRSLFRYLAAGSHPDHDILVSFRRRFLDELAGIFLKLRELAGDMKLLKLGTINLDGTKLHASALRQSSRSYGHIQPVQAQVQELLKC